MEAGFEFLGASASVSMTAEASIAEREYVSHSLEMKKEESLEISCINEDRNTVVSLYRW